MRVAAVDLGATSARVAVVDTDTRHVEVVHRYPHQPVVHGDGSLRWDWARLVAEVERGLSIALERDVTSVGIDTWGVDYGLIDGGGDLVAPPFSYRDARTSTWRAVVDRIGERRLYETTGLQLMEINTIFQLAAHDRGELGRATTLLMLPELLVHHLTGTITAETTSAGTTGLVSLATDSWADDLIDDIGVRRELFPAIARPGTGVGDWRGVPVHLVGGHDTASAVAARPGPTGPERAFISTGTWVLVGVELSAPITTDAARAANFSNERSVNGGYRLLKNVTGLWLLERCRDAWGNTLVEPSNTGGPVIDPNDERLARATHMPSAIAQAAGLDIDDRAAIVRCIFDSVAAAAARVVVELGAVTGTPITDLDLFGGGAQIPFLVDRIGAATGLPCTVGSPEATALGNALTQICATKGG